MVGSRMLAAVGAVLVLGACGQATDATEDTDRGAATSPDAVAESGPAEVADPVAARGCAPWDEPPTYDPPPDQQPDPDPVITHADVVPDLPVERDADAEADLDVPAGASAYEVARAWAEREAPDQFGGVWQDLDHGAAVIAFTDDVDHWAEQVRARFGAGWWVVRADHSAAELDRLVAEADGAWDEDGGGHVAPGDVVSLFVPLDRHQVVVTVVGGDDGALADVAARFDHPAHCFEVLPPPPTLDPVGEVRVLARAAGWRADLDALLHGEDPGPGDVLEVADDPATGAVLWAENVPDDLPPGDREPVSVDARFGDLDDVDWDREVLAVWSSGASGSCPAWVEDVRPGNGGTVVEVASTPAFVCDDVWQPYRVVVAVARDRLPPIEDLPVPAIRAGRGFEGVDPDPRDRIVAYPVDATP